MNSNIDVFLQFLRFFKSITNPCFLCFHLGRHVLVYKTKAALIYLHKHHFNDAEWFVKADDDTYFIVENLRDFLSYYNPRYPYFFGRYFQVWTGVNVGGAGYVFSKQLLQEFNELLIEPDICPIYPNSNEDIWVSKCLQMGIKHSPDETRDEHGKERFFQLSPDFYLLPDGISENHWIYKYSNSKVGSGINCCSKSAISFHKTLNNYIYEIDYFKYYLKVFSKFKH